MLHFDHNINVLKKDWVNQKIPPVSSPLRHSSADGFDRLVATHLKKPNENGKEVFSCKHSTFCNIRVQHIWLRQASRTSAEGRRSMQFCNLWNSVLEECGNAGCTWHTNKTQEARDHHCSSIGFDKGPKKEAGQVYL